MPFSVFLNLKAGIFNFIHELEALTFYLLNCPFAKLLICIIKFFILLSQIFASRLQKV